MTKPTVRKVAGRWCVVRPGYGFTTGSVTEYPTWKAALKALDSGPGSAGASTEKGAHTLGQWRGYWPARPRWIDVSAPNSWPEYHPEEPWRRR